MRKEQIDYAFATSNVKNMPFEEYEKNFIFAVNGKYYETSRFLADLISPIIRKYHYDDKTFDKFTITTNLNIQEKEAAAVDYFKDFLNLISFEEVTLEDYQLIHFAEYFLQLGNIDEYLRLKNEYFENLTPQNVIDRLKLIYEQIKKASLASNEFFSSDKMDKIISFAASHFTEIDKNELKTLKEEIIEEIIGNESLKIDEEDTLLQFIVDLYENDSKYSSLFKYIIFENINDTSFSMFVEKISVEDINSQTWRFICQRIQHSSQKVEINPNRYKLKVIKIEYKNGEEFNGIFNYLTKKTGGNIHENGTIEISSNSIFSSDRHPKNLLNSQDSSLFHSKDEKNVEIRFDFKDKKVKIRNYSIKSYLCGKNTNHLKNWIVDASNDGLDWIIIDSHENDPMLNKANTVATFDVKNANDFYRYIRIRQTGTNWMNKDFLILHSMEFYGEIKCENQ